MIDLIPNEVYIVVTPRELVNLKFIRSVFPDMLFKNLDNQGQRLFHYLKTIIFPVGTPVEVIKQAQKKLAEEMMSVKRIPILNIDNSGDTEPLSVQLKDFDGNIIPSGTEVFKIETPDLKPTYYKYNDLLRYYLWRLDASYIPNRYPNSPEGAKKNGDKRPGMNSNDPNFTKLSKKVWRIGENMETLYPDHKITRLTLRYKEGGYRKTKCRSRKQRHSRKQRQ